MKLGEILVTAGEYTLLGMGTVFVVLIIIAIVISCFGILRKAVNAKAPEPVEEPAVPVVSEQSGDDQLIAVITAAIAAHMASEVSAAPREGEYVVRSIRRATWKHTLSE